MMNELDLIEALKQLTTIGAQCRICNHQYTAWVPVYESAEDLPCPNCECNAGQPTEEGSRNFSE